jgi:hypothetical protein
LAQERPANAEVAIIAASSGFSDEPLVAIEARLDAAINALPDSVIAWLNWLIDFFKDDPESYNVLLGNDAGTALYVMRGTKTGGDPTAAEFECLKSGLQAWLSGRPICDIERALGVEPEDLGKCLRARSFEARKQAPISCHFCRCRNCALALRTARRPDSDPGAPRNIAGRIPQGLRHARQGRVCTISNQDSIACRTTQRLRTRNWCAAECSREGLRERCKYGRSDFDSSSLAAFDIK